MAGGFYQLWFAVRYLHIAAAAILIGGAVLMCALCARGTALGPTAAFDVASAYEWIFWTVIALSVATGVSNLGLKGDGLLPAQTQWGAALTLKLGEALLLLCLAAVRTDVITRCRERGGATAGRARPLLTSLYAVTALVLLGMLWLGLGLAHGRY